MSTSKSAQDRGDADKDEAKPQPEKQLRRSKRLMERAAAGGRAVPKRISKPKYIFKPYSRPKRIVKLPTGRHPTYCPRPRGRPKKSNKKSSDSRAAQPTEDVDIRASWNFVSWRYMCRKIAASKSHS